MAIDNEPKASDPSVVDDSSADSAASRLRRRKRKWDQPADSLVSAGVVVPVILPLPNMLSAMGIAHPGTSATFVPPNPLHPKLQDEVIAREIVINDAEASLRYKLTKRQTQDEIQKCTGAIVITRGKYRPPNTVSDGEKPLYLHISAGSHLKEMAEKIIAVDQAAAMVEEMLKQNNILLAASTTHPSGNVVKALNACVFLGFDADPSANITSRIRGPNDQYINHIMNETGATVLLRGRGSGNAVGVHSNEEQPLHLFISSNNPKSLEDARLLAENLLDTISMEFGASRVSSLKMYNAVPPPQHLLSAAQSSSSGPEGNITASITLNGTPFVGSLSSPLSFMQGIAAVGSNQVISQPGFIHNAQHSLSSGTNYNGYSGLYPQATPLQQVAFALKQPSVTNTSVVVPSISQDPNMDTRSTAHSEKNPPRRRKFQEQRVATQGSTQEHKGLLREPVADASASAKRISVMPAPKKLVQSSSNGMPPPPPRDMPPPPQKLTSSKQALKLHEQNTSVLRSETVPDPLVKLMEYGDDDDDDEDSVERIQESSQNRQLTPATPKPFWSL